MSEVRIYDPVAERRVDEAGIEQHRVVVRIDLGAGPTLLTAGWFLTREKALQGTLVMLTESLDPDLLVTMFRLRVVDMPVSPGQGTYLDRMEKDE